MEPVDPLILDRLTGCLLGGAIGDALGAGIEFHSIEEIRRRYGDAGVTGYVPAYGRLGAITDDTQMTLFTLEGLIRASGRRRPPGIGDAPSEVRFAYLRWFHTQGGRLDADQREHLDGWLLQVPELHSRRAPGNTCLGALTLGGPGRVDAPVNDSKGCGGVMRAAPAGFVPGSPDERFRLGCDIAAITHGHPSGYLPAGYLAAAVGELIDGRSLDRALDVADEILLGWHAHDETLAAVRAGRRLGATGLPAPEAVHTLGGGWVGEEALAISIACAVGAPDLRSALLAAVNHTGDSDSTGAITGNLLGARDGTAVLPREWLADLELRDVMERLATDATLELRGQPVAADGSAAAEEWFGRYPRR